MKTPQINFLAFSTLGIIGNFSNEYSRNAEIARIYGTSQLSETIKTFSNLAGFIDLFLFPVLSGAYIGFIVYIYQHKIRDKFQIPKAALVILIIILSLIGWVVLMFLLGLAMGSM